MTKAPVRLEYEARVTALRGRADAMHRNGSSPEAIARTMHAARRALCQIFREQTPEPLRTRILERTRAIYGDPLGPSVEFLRLRGKSWEDINASASRPGRLPPLTLRSTLARSVEFPMAGPLGPTLKPRRASSAAPICSATRMAPGMIAGVLTDIADPEAVMLVLS
jgi:hypothetical protein